MVAKIKSGDLVKVIRGKDRGKEGTVKRVLKDDRLIVEAFRSSRSMCVQPSRVSRPASSPLRPRSIAPT